ncbi:MAG: Hsp20/alpha crystallin family protein [Verrucomicrobia bacterium]|nr:MAG: Hsp20/alpha crystallin family protein [Verrucomicrobiota bacterium]
MAVNWNKLKPWNWFKKEQNQQASRLPVRRAEVVDHPLARLHEELDRVFEDVFRGFGLPAWRPFWSAPVWEGFRPSVDISENRKGYTIRVEVPGVEKEDLSVTVEDDTLVIAGEKKQEKEEDEGGYHCVERSYGAFRRLISLPADADQDKLEARFRNGVLTITIPKVEGARSAVREVTIQ